MKYVSLIVLLLCSFSVAATELPLNAQSVLVIDADNQEVLYERNSDDVRSIASITKLMTAVVILDAHLDMNEQIRITQDDLKHTELRGRATSSSLAVGTTLSREELLRLTLMNSQNRAAVALARTYPGGREAFIADMNLKAIELGMFHTTYVDPSGLFNENKSTAEDLAILLQAARLYPEICEFSTAPTYSLANNHKTFGTTNRLVHSKAWNIVLQKTGYIRDAGRCVVMMTEVAYRSVIIVLLDTSSSQSRAKDAVTIKYWLENNTIPSARQVSNLSPYKAVSHKRHRSKKI